MAGPGGQEVGRVSVRVVPNTENFRRELKAQLEKEIAGLDLEVPVGADFDANGLRAKAKAAAKSAGQTVKFDTDLDRAIAAVGKRVKLDVDLDDDRLLRKFAAFKPRIKAEVDVDSNFLRRSVSKLGDAFGSFFSGVSGGGSSGGGGKGAQVLMQFADTMVVVAAVAGIVAPAIALATGALVALPGVLAGVLVPIGAVALGLEGIGRAAVVLKEPFASLKESLSGTFEDRFSPIFTKLAGVIPQLDGPLTVVANGISNVAESIGNMIVDGGGLELIKGTIENIGTAISDSAPGVTNLTNGLLGLAEGVSAKFPAVATWINKVGDSFSTWVEKVSSDGSLDRAMGNFGETLKGVLDIVGDIAAQGFEWLQDPAFANSMKTFVADVQTLVRDVMPGLGGMFEQIGGVIHGITGVLDKINGWDPPDWMGLDGDKPDSKGSWLTPPEAPTGWDASADDVVKFRENVEAARKAASDEQGFGAFPGMNKPDEPFIDMGGLFDGIERRITDGSWWTGLFRAGLGSAEGPQQTMADIFDINSFLAAPGVKIIDFFKNTVGVGLPQAAAETGVQVGGQLGQKMGESFATAAPQMQAALAPQVQSQVTAAIAPIQQVPAQIQQAFSGIGAAVTGSMATVVGAVAGASSQIVAAFTGNLSQIPGVAAQTFNAVASAAAAGMANVVSTIAAGAAQAVATVTAMGQQIVAALQSAAAGAQAAGAAVGQGMAAGIAASKGAAVAAAQDLAAAVSAAAKVELGVKSPSKVFTEIGANTVQGLQNGLEGGFDGVIQRAQSLAEQLTTAVNDGLTGVDGELLGNAIKQQLDELELQRKALKVEKNALPKEDKEGRAALQTQMDQITALKDQLKLQEDQLGFGGKYADSTDSVTQANNIITEQIASMIDMVKGFANATAGQFMSDLGMSGNGAIPTVAGMGLDWATGLLADTLSAPFGGGKSGGKTEIHVNSVDEALAARQNITNKDALRYRQR